MQIFVSAVRARAPGSRDNNNNIIIEFRYHNRIVGGTGDASETDLGDKKKKKIKKSTTHIRVRSSVAVSFHVLSGGRLSSNFPILVRKLSLTARPAQRRRRRRLRTPRHSIGIQDETRPTVTSGRAAVTSKP